ncbi:MAG: NUDIX hydrolase [Ardenticatenaceae bacterium]|nr:NUDIX hydrolase [Ardenticatenaceae bacterium]MCB9444225.1 NUDIX hydrolase [Ardenticatenaceae bacterium]
MTNSAPEEFAYCPRCAAPLVTRPVMDKPRRTCPECGFVYFTDPKVGVGVLVVAQDKVLLVRRSVPPEKGKWSIPAGFLDRGEDPRETAVREALEETNLIVEIEGLVDVYYNVVTGGPGASVFILYRARLLGGEIRAGDDADAAAFFGLDELPELAFASTRDAIARLKS